MEYAQAAGQSTVGIRAQGGYQTEATERILVLDSAISDTNRATNRVHALADQIRQRADSIFGPRPPAPSPTGIAGSQGNKVAVPFRASGLRMATSELHEALHILESEAERFADI